VVLLHAWGESGRAFDRLLPLISPEVLAVALDQRGHGDSDKPAEGYSLEGLARDVEALMDGLGVASAVLVGSSSGGYVAQQVALDHPDRVDGLVLVGSPRTLQARPAFADEVEALTDPVDDAWVRRSLTWFPRFVEVPAWYVEDRVREGVRLPAHVWRTSFEGLLAARPPTEAASITTPTLVIWGDHDTLLPREEQERLAAALPGSRLVVYEGTGHLVLWEQPERVASDLRTFLATLPPPRLRAAGRPGGTRGQPPP
jgi:rifampin ADP-ribosylating transferase